MSLARLRLMTASLVSCLPEQLRVKAVGPDNSRRVAVRSSVDRWHGPVVHRSVGIGQRPLAAADEIVVSHAIAR